MDQRRRRWADVVQMLYKCFVFAGMVLSATYYTLQALQYIMYVFTNQQLCLSTATHNLKVGKNVGRFPH